MFSDFFDKVYNYLGNIPFDTLIALIWGSYLAIFVAAFIANMCSGKIKAASKRPFLWLTNAYTAVTLAAFLLKCELASSLTASLIFWVIGYIRRVKRVRRRTAKKIRRGASGCGKLYPLAAD